MDLQAKVKQKNSQLLVHRNVLLLSMRRHVVASDSKKLLPAFVIASFFLGFISYRARGFFGGIQALKMVRRFLLFGRS